MPITDSRDAPEVPYVARYIELDGDVFEAIKTQFGTCLINRTRPLRLQIEALQRLAQEGK